MKPPAESAYQQGLELHRSGRLAEACALYRETLKLRPNHGQALHQLGVIALQSNRPDVAVELIGKAARIDSKSAEIQLNRGTAQHQLGRYPEALASFERAAALAPDLPDAHNNRGVALRSVHRLEAALASHDRAIALRPDFADAFNNRGIVLADMNRYAEALASYDQSIALNPRLAVAFDNRGLTLAALGRNAEAVDSYDRAIAIHAGFSDAYNNRGTALATLGRHLEALASYDRAIALTPGHVHALNNRGNALHALERFQDAIASFDQVIAIDPQHAVAYNNRGISLAAMKSIEQALASYGRALELRSDYPEAHNNRGIAMRAMRLLEAAVTCFDRAIALRPEYSGALANRGNALCDLKRYEAALESFDRALIFEPTMKFLPGIRLQTKLYMCDWRNLDTELRLLIEGVERGAPATNPMSFLSLSDSEPLHRKVAETWARHQYPRPAASVGGGRRAGTKLRVGYFSADFRAHAVATLTARLFEVHDRAKFEWIAFSMGSDTQDPMRKRLETAFDRFIDVRGRMDWEVALLAKSLQLDVAVDLSGYTLDARPGIFARRAAPVQIGYLGYPATLGAGLLDYLLADSTVIPEDSRCHYDEQVIELPHCYLPSDSQRPIASKAFTREEVGLPATGFVFCCFNNNYKITPAMFDVWMRVLTKVPGGVLWLPESEPRAMDNLRHEAQSRGIDAGRLIFAARLPSPAEHLARIRLADLFLDTLPYNAHSTGSDALWAGVPLLTCLGRSFAGRVGASLLRALDLPELISLDLQQYERLAIELATDRQQLDSLRNKLARQRRDAPLFDTEQHARYLESAYLAAHERHLAGAKPAAFAVAGASVEVP